MLRIRDKVLISLLMLGVDAFLVFLGVNLVTSAFEPPNWWLVLAIGIPIFLMLLAIVVWIACGIWYVWKKMPTLTKKNEALLEQWLKNNGYVRCKEVNVETTRTFDYYLDKKGNLVETDKQISGQKIIVIEDGVVNEFVPSFSNAVALLNNYEIRVQENDFMILTFKYDKTKFLVYRKHSS